MKEKIAEQIRLNRLISGLSQQNIADELNITVSAYSNIERGVTDITVTRLYEISEILDVNPLNLLLKIEENSLNSNTLKDKEFQYKKTNNDNQLLEILNKLNIQESEMELIKNEIKKLKNS